MPDNVSLLAQAVSSFERGIADSDLERVTALSRALQAAVEQAEARREWKTPDFLRDLGLETSISITREDTGVCRIVNFLRDGKPVVQMTGTASQSVWEKHGEMRTNNTLELEIQEPDCSPHTWTANYYGSVFERTGDYEGTEALIEVMRDKLGIKDAIEFLGWLSLAMDIYDQGMFMSEMEGLFEEYEAGDDE